MLTLILQTNHQVYTSLENSIADIQYPETSIYNIQKIRYTIFRKHALLNGKKNKFMEICKKENCNPKTITVCGSDAII